MPSLLFCENVALMYCLRFLVMLKNSVKKIKGRIWINYHTFDPYKLQRYLVQYQSSHTWFTQRMYQVVHNSLMTLHGNSHGNYLIVVYDLVWWHMYPNCYNLRKFKSTYWKPFNQTFPPATQFVYNSLKAYMVHK